MAGGAPPWAPAHKETVDEGDDKSSATTAGRAGRRPSLSGGLPPWAPASKKAAEIPADARDTQDVHQKTDSDSAEKPEKLAAPEGARVIDWLAAAAAEAGPGKVSIGLEIGDVFNRARRTLRSGGHVCSDILVERVNRMVDLT